MIRIRFPPQNWRHFEDPNPGPLEGQMILRIAGIHCQWPFPSTQPDASSTSAGLKREETFVGSDFQEETRSTKLKTS